MDLPFQDSLARLIDLPDDRLHRTSLRWREALGDSEWKLSLCLLAWQRRGVPPSGYRSLTHYAEFGLQLSGKKMARLLASARALEHLPVFSKAFREGRVEWSKVRELQTLITPETEREWLEYAQTHSAAQVARKVTASPQRWKRQQALIASLRGQPIADSKMVSEILEADNSERDGDRHSQNAEATIDAPASSEPPDDKDGEVAGLVGRAEDAPRELPGGMDALRGSGALPDQVRLIRVTVDLTPDQYAAYEAGKKVLEARAGRRLKRGEVVMLMAEAVLNNAPARARARHQILIHTAPGSAQGWYETDRGILPVSPGLLDFVKEVGLPPIVVADLADGAPTALSGPGTFGPAPFSQEIPLEEKLVVPVGAAIPTGEKAVTPVGAVIPTRPNPVVPAGAEIPTRGKPGAPAGEGIPTREKPAIPADAAVPAREKACRGTARRAIPMGVIRAVVARAAGRCEHCDSDGPLHFHHPLPVCEGGGNDASDLKLVCEFCHHGEHVMDFKTKAHWARAKARAREAAGGRSHHRESPS